MAELSRAPRSISHDQRRRLFGLAKRRGMSTDGLRAATPDGSIGALSRAEASRLIAELGGAPLANPPGQAPPTKKHRPAEGCVRMITSEHVGQIARLLDDYFGRNMPTRGYDWLQKNWSKNGVQVKTLRDLGTARRAGQVIRVLREMIERREAPVGEVAQQR